jgi:Domain of unknown function (DUF4873)
MHDDDDIDYEGPATVALDGVEVPVQVRLAGHFQPIDGHYHWYGRIAASQELTAVVGGRGKAACTLTTSAGTAEAKLAELDLWNRYRIAGVDTPPFHVISAVEDVS